MRITLKQLRDNRACREQVDLFESLNGHMIEITESLVLEHSDKFQWDWAARNLLSREGFSEYERAKATAEAEYDRAAEAAQTEYRRATVSAWAEYQRALDSAEDDYKRALDASQTEYRRARATAESDYQRAIALAFFRLYEKESAQ